MDKIMYLVTQTSGEYEDRIETKLLLTEDLDKAIDYKKTIDVDCSLDTITEPMTYKEFEEYKEGYPDNWNEADYCEYIQAGIEYDDEPAVDRGPYKAEDFKAMREKVERLMFDPVYPCDIFEVTIGEEAGFKWLNPKDYENR